MDGEQLQMFETKGVENLNPAAGTVKDMEMIVLRSLMVIAAFEALDDGHDWTSVPGTEWRKIFGDKTNVWYANRPLLGEMWKRFEDGTLYRQVLDLFANLPPAVQERKEIADGIQRISARPPGRGKGRAVHAPARQRSR